MFSLGAIEGGPGWDLRVRSDVDPKLEPKPADPAWAQAEKKENCATSFFEMPNPKIGQIVGFGNVCGPQMDPGLAGWPEIESIHIHF